MKISASLVKFQIVIVIILFFTLQVVAKDDEEINNEQSNKLIVGLKGDNKRGRDSPSKKVDTQSKVLKKSIQKLRQKSKKMDVVFLIDSSSSVGKQNFKSEIQFLKKMLADFDVSLNYTRVAIVTFSSQAKIVSLLERKTNSI